MIHSSKTSSIDTIFSVDTKIGVSTKLVLVKETVISTGSVISKATHLNPVGSKQVKGLGTETIIGIIAASITVGIALLFLCGRSFHRQMFANDHLPTREFRID
ncbi:8066_t:CDS:2 [Rhizophagus irregularis]|nr:8066_t:CDS:2 [Rhizophagus irregularis]